MMTTFEDPLNLIICGVGGQGNIMASRLVARALVREGYYVTIGETFGAAQRGGSVMSHLRISKERLYGPFIPRCKADIVLGLEPAETLRMLVSYGNAQVATITNLHPLPPPFVEASTGVVVGSRGGIYPDHEMLKEAIRELSGLTRFLNATQTGTNLGAPIVANVVMLGALIGVNLLPLNQQDMEATIRDNIAPNRVELNLRAFESGLEEMKNAQD